MKPAHGTVRRSGILLVAVIIGWSFALNWLAHRSARVARILRLGPLLLIRDGELLHRNMRKEMITEDQLREQARKQGIADLAVVREGRIESDGRFSFIVGAMVGTAPAAFMTTGPRR